MKSLGEKIKEARKSAGLKQRELAEQLFVHYVTLSDYERGKTTPGLDTVEKIADFTGHPLAWFFLEDGQEIVGAEKPPFDPVATIAVMKEQLDQLAAVVAQKTEQSAEPEPERPSNVVQFPTKPSEESEVEEVQRLVDAINPELKVEHALAQGESLQLVRDMALQARTSKSAARFLESLCDPPEDGWTGATGEVAREDEWDE